MNEDQEIYISLSIEDVQDWEDNREPIVVTFKALYLDKTTIKEEEYKCGPLEDLIFFLEYD